MFGLYMLAIYLGIAIIAAGFVALLVVVALAVGLVTHPIRTLALVFHKLAALAAGLALILALIVWFWYDHSKMCIRDSERHEIAIRAYTGSQQRAVLVLQPSVGADEA